MTMQSDVSPSHRSKNRRASGAKQAQWQFQANLLDQLSDAVIAVDLDERITYLNRAAVAQYGVDPVNAIGQPLSHLYRDEWLQPEDELLADAALTEQGHWRGENRHIRRDGSTRHVESLVIVLRDEAGNATDLLVTIRDITDRKQAEADQQLLADLAEQIRLADEPEALISTVVQMVGNHLRVGRCLWIEIYAAEQRGFIHAQHCRDLPLVPESYANADYSPVTRAELAAGHVLVNHDAQQDPRTAARYETVYAPYQERAYVGVPFLREGVWRGILSVTTPAPRQWQAREISLLETVAERVWLAVDKLRLVAELRANEARYRTIFEHAGVSLWEEDFSRLKRAVDELTATWRAAGVTDLAAAMRAHCAAHPDFVQTMLERVRILDVNEETVRLYGRPKAELLRPFDQHFDAETLTHFVNELVLIAEGGQRYTFDGLVETPQGEVRHVAFTVVFPSEADGDFTRVLLSGLDVTARKAAEAENHRLLLATQSLLAQVPDGARFL